MDIVLIAGMWLDATAWNDVVPELERLGHRPVALTLPGQGDGDATATYDDQVAAVTAAVDAADGPALVVGHSAACALAWVAADARPDRSPRVALIGGHAERRRRDLLRRASTPSTASCRSRAGSPSRAPTPTTCRPSLKAAVARGAIAVPAAVTQGVVRLQRRASLRRAGHDGLPGVHPRPGQGVGRRAATSPSWPRRTRVDYVDIDSGHWPMFTKPVELARILADCAAG